RIDRLRVPRADAGLELWLRRGGHRHAVRAGAVHVGTEIPAWTRRIACAGQVARTGPGRPARMGDLPRRARRTAPGRMADVGGGQRRVLAGWRGIAGAGADDRGDAGGPGVVPLVHRDQMHAGAAPADDRADLADRGVPGLLYPVRADLRFVGDVYRPHADQGCLAVAGAGAASGGVDVGHRYEPGDLLPQCAVVDRVAAAGAGGVHGVGDAVGPRSGLDD